MSAARRPTPAPTITVPLALFEDMVGVLAERFSKDAHVMQLVTNESRGTVRRAGARRSASGTGRRYMRRVTPWCGPGYWSQSVSLSKYPHSATCSRRTRRGEGERVIWWKD